MIREWNKVYYCDCLDPKIGLPSLPDKSIDLCITDPPFNVNLKKNLGKTIESHKFIYKDNLNENIYKNWCERWFLELERICNTIIIYCGKKNLKHWINIRPPRDVIFRISKNTQSGGSFTYFQRVFPLVCYGKILSKLKKDFFIYESYCGNHFKKDKTLLHPVPLREDFWYDLISQLKPKSVVDPFIGSGTTAEVCTKLGIPWIGYEINEIYRQDIEKRLRGCVKEPEQVDLLKYVIH